MATQERSIMTKGQKWKPKEKKFERLDELGLTETRKNSKTGMPEVRLNSLGLSFVKAGQELARILREEEIEEDIKTVLSDSVEFRKRAVIFATALRRRAKLKQK